MFVDRSRATSKPRLEFQFHPWFPVPAAQIVAQPLLNRASSLFVPTHISSVTHIRRSHVANGFVIVTMLVIRDTVKLAWSWGDLKMSSLLLGGLTTREVVQALRKNKCCAQ